MDRNSLSLLSLLALGPRMLSGLPRGDGLDSRHAPELQDLEYDRDRIRKLEAAEEANRKKFPSAKTRAKLKAKGIRIAVSKPPKRRRGPAWKRRPL